MSDIFYKIQKFLKPHAPPIITNNGINVLMARHLMSNLLTNGAVSRKAPTPGLLITKKRWYVRKERLIT